VALWALLYWWAQLVEQPSTPQGLPGFLAIDRPLIMAHRGSRYESSIAIASRSPVVEETCLMSALRAQLLDCREHDRRTHASVPTRR